MIGARRIAGCRAYPAVFFRDQFVIRQFFVFTVGPIFLAHALVQVFGKRFRKPVGQRFQENGAVIVMLLFELLDAFVDTETSRNRECPDVIL